MFTQTHYVHTDTMFTQIAAAFFFHFARSATAFTTVIPYNRPAHRSYQILRAWQSTTVEIDCSIEVCLYSILALST